MKPLSQGEVVPRAEREKRARELLEAYARSLEEACCRAPRQWFNFYDFWDAPGRRMSRVAQQRVEPHAREPALVEQRNEPR